jgi:arginase
VNKEIKVITIESDFGAGKKGAKLGPQATIKQLQVLGNQLVGNSDLVRVQAEGLETENLPPFSKNIESILDVHQRALLAVESVLHENKFPFVISGDHSNGAAVISAIKNFHHDKKLGVIWIDAHADLHSPFTTPSGNMHGMPLAVNLGVDDGLDDEDNEVSEKEVKLWQQLLTLGDKKITPKILPEDLVFIDLRDFEEEEELIINNMGIKYFTPEIRNSIGIEAILNQTIQHLQSCDLIYVSFDVDSLDPEISIGTGTPVPNGLSIDEAAFLLSNLLKNEKIVGLEFTEINPLLDRDKPMEMVAASLINQILN